VSKKRQRTKSTKVYIVVPEVYLLVPCSSTEPSLCFICCTTVTDLQSKGDIIEATAYNELIGEYHSQGKGNGQRGVAQDLGAICRTLEGHSRSVCRVAFSHNSRLVASASSDNIVRLWDSVTGITLRTLKGHLNVVSRTAFSPEGRLLTSTSDDSTVRLWNLT
jgi:WD40 repeat protein